MIKLLKKTLFILGILLLLAACGKDKAKYSKILIKKLDGLNSLLTYIEINYADVLQDSLKVRERIVFINCEKEGELSDNYMCESKDVIDKMKELGLREVRFERVKVDCETDKIFTEVYFQEKKLFYYPVVYFLYEYCETKSAIETNTIYYKPVDKHWSVYIDSNFP